MLCVMKNLSFCPLVSLKGGTLGIGRQGWIGKYRNVFMEDLHLFGHVVYHEKFEPLPISYPSGGGGDSKYW